MRLARAFQGGVVGVGLVKLGGAGVDGCHALFKGVKADIAIGVCVNGCSCLQSTQADQAQGPVRCPRSFRNGVNHAAEIPCLLVNLFTNILINELLNYTFVSMYCAF
jgi:hypothetical protein